MLKSLFLVSIFVLITTVCIFNPQISNASIKEEIEIIVESSEESLEEIEESLIEIEEESSQEESLIEIEEESSQEESLIEIEEESSQEESSSVEVLNQDISEESSTESSTVEEEYVKIIENVAYINQLSEFPTGCESVAAVMALNFLGIDISVGTFVDTYLDKGNAPYTVNGVTYACDPWEAFVGDPRTYGGYGCYNTVIANAINKFIDTSAFTVSADIGLSIEYLCETYIDNDIPVLLWVTDSMYSIYDSTLWVIEGTDEYFQWLSPMHCMLLVGYDDNYYYFHDSLNSSYVKYSKSSTEMAYSGMGSQSLTIIPVDE